MLVEDDATIVDILSRQLEKWGYLVRAVQDFDRVMEEFREFQPQLVLMDLSLPFFNGYYWCTEIRKISRVPVLFLSSASDDMNLIMAINMGADDFIAKPFKFEVVLAKIQAIIRRTYDFRKRSEYVELSGSHPEPWGWSGFLWGRKTGAFQKRI